MDLFRRLFGRRSSPGTQHDPHGYHLYAQCGTCGGLVHTRIDLRNDLSPDDEGGFSMRKTLVDDRCFRRMEVMARFDARRRPVEQQIEGGRLLSREEFDSLAQAR